VVTRLTRSALTPLAVATMLMAALTGCIDDPSSAQETAPEKAAIERVLATCPGEPLANRT
jgi:hypothetical protein